MNGKDDGLVETKRDNVDRRVVNIILTDKGRGLLERSRPVARDIVTNVMSSISEADAVVFEKFLKVLIQNAETGLNALAERN